jgi:hypothetical protein
VSEWKVLREVLFQRNRASAYPLKILFPRMLFPRALKAVPGLRCCVQGQTDPLNSVILKTPPIIHLSFSDSDSGWDLD